MPPSASIIAGIVAGAAAAAGLVALRFDAHRVYEHLLFGRGIFALARGPRDGQTLVTLHNLTDMPRAAAGEWPAGGAGEWDDLISGNRFDPGSGLRLAPYQVLWLEVARR